MGLPRVTTARLPPARQPLLDPTLHPGAITMVLQVCSVTTKSGPVCVGHGPPRTSTQLVLNKCLQDEPTRAEQSNCELHWLIPPCPRPPSQVVTEHLPRAKVPDPLEPSGAATPGSRCRWAAAEGAGEGPMPPPKSGEGGGSPTPLCSRGRTGYQAQTGDLWGPSGSRKHAVKEETLGAEQVQAGLALQPGRS